MSLPDQTIRPDPGEVVLDTNPARPGVAPAAPVLPSRGRFRPLGVDDVRVTGGFWAELQERNAGTMIGHAYSWMERLGWIGNFDAAVQGRLPGARRGREFSDSEIYKLLEAMAWEVARTGDPGMDARLRAWAGRVGAAQDRDGYVNTMFGRPGQGDRYSDLEWGHELYCFGHLIQAGVARARTGFDDELVQVAMRAADHVCSVFGPDGLVGVCGHPEIEVALAELYRVTGRRQYLDQARLFVQRRGRGLLEPIEFGAQYFQDDVPVRSARVLDGHAVRALYLAAGAVDVAVEDGDEGLLASVTEQVLTTLSRRTYLTGGMGAHHEGESFGQDWELPPDRAYSETCAGVGSVMVNHRLLLATGDVRHADAIERTLYNVVAASPAQDGRAFFYTNTLQERVPGKVPAVDEVSARAASSMRAPWFAVSCCPSNLTRTLASLAGYLATVDDSGVQVHQYADATVRAAVAGGEIVLRMRTDYPHDGRVEFTIVHGPGADWSLTLRVPSWAHGARLIGLDGQVRSVDPGYVSVDVGQDNDGTIVLDLPLTPRWTWADPRVDAVRGQVAVERGPVVLCLESVDLGVDVASVVIDASTSPVEHDGQVMVHAISSTLVDQPWPYGSDPDQAVISRHDHGLVPLVPYHDWANRGPATMRVWLPVAGDC